MAGERATTVDSRGVCTAPVDPGRRLRRNASATGQRLSSQQCSGECTLGTPSEGRRLKLKIAEYRKAMVGGIGAITAAAVPLSPFLPGGVAHWLAAAAAVLTGFATYLTKNATPAAVEKPAAQDIPASPPQDAPSQPPASPPARRTGPVLAGLALIVGGAVLAGRHTERHSRCVTLLPHGYAGPRA
jgi:hypothetical protein